LKGGGGGGGRPPGLGGRVVFVILLVLARGNSSLLVTCTADIVQYRFSNPPKAMLGINPDTAGDADWYDRFWRGFSLSLGCDRRVPWTEELLRGQG
ncbi:MAG: hypothetical protein ACYCTG_08670, partial [Ferrimicrobium sp.]